MDKFMECDLCHKQLRPLDAHMGRLQGKLITAHIDCWNNEVKNSAHGEQEYKND